MAQVKVSEFTQNFIVRKKSDYEIYNDLRLAIGAKKMAEKLGVNPSTERKYYSTIKNKLSGGNTQISKSAIWPSKKLFKKTKQVSKKIKAKDLKVRFKTDDDGKRVKVQNPELTNKGKLRQTKKTQPNIIKGIRANVVSEKTKKNLQKEFKNKNISMVIWRYRYEYFLKNQGLISGWATVVYKGKSFMKAIEKLNDQIHAKSLKEYVFSAKVMELNYEIIHKLKK